MAISGSWAQFYDLDPTFPDDLPFYRALLRPGFRVLELGCGTGRVLVPLAAECARMVGLDASPSMLEVCRRKVAASGLPADRVSLVLGDMSRFDLGERFDLVLTPYRSFQDLVDERQVEGFFRCVAAHLTKRGSLILNVHHSDVVRLEQWCAAEEELCWREEEGNTAVTCHAHGLGLDPHRQVHRQRLVFRQYLEGELEEVAEWELAMRYYWPEQVEEVVRDRGFVVLERWGGYHGEAWGAGPELLLRCSPWADGR